MENLIGLTLESAKERLKGKEYRIVRIDGVGMIITCDWHPNRVNLEIQNNIVTRVYGG